MQHRIRRVFRQVESFGDEGDGVEKNSAGTASKPKKPISPLDLIDLPGKKSHPAKKGKKTRNADADGALLDRVRAVMCSLWCVFLFYFYVL